MKGRRAAAFVGLLFTSTLLACSGGQGCRPVCGTAAPDAPAFEVLMLGNSYTFVGDVPGRLRDLGTQLLPAVTMEVDSIAIPGNTLHQLYDRPDVHAKIASGHWTHVVFQDQSTDPLREPKDFHQYARLFADEIRRAGAVPVLYETWARRDGSEEYKYAFTGKSFTAMQAELDHAYESAAAETGSRLAPVGDARARALQLEPAIPLYIDDGSHPTSQGAYLAACVIFRTIAGLTTTGARAPTEFSSDVARALQGVADGTPVAVTVPSPTGDR